ncbi:MAG: ABC-F family ATP-binding cassette domain-containing protein [Alphaproteobacteria bacterium]
MTQIRLENVSFGYAETLFEGLTLAITDNDRIGIVGNNGSGKSTLLKCISGEIEPTKGRIIRSKGLKFGFMEQDVPEALKNENLYDVISAAIPKDERDVSAWKVDIALDAFKAPDDIRTRPISELSGGWQRLALIARLALSEPDVILLDEPTNHLDVAKIILLEQWLNEQVYNVPLITISHDRSFLANCTNKTVILRAGQAHVFDYPYETAIDLLAEQDKSSSAQRAKELKEIDRLERSAHELRQIGVNNRSFAALRKSTQIAKRAENIGADLTDVHIEARRDIKLGNSGIQAKRLLGIENMTINAPDGTMLFHIDKLDISPGERLVIMGPNGSGKTQFLNRLHLAFDDPDDGRKEGIAITPSAKLGYLDQHLSYLPLDQSLKDYFSRSSGLDEQKAIGALVGAGFPVRVQAMKLGKLSHGQRARVALLGLQLSNQNFYILDEPTNHLDIAGQRQLESEIISNEAACVLVSHDRKFAENIGTKFYAIQNHKLVQIASPDAFYASLLDAPDITAVRSDPDTKKKPPSHTP